VEFLDKEIFISLFDGQEYEADIVARARFKGTEAFFLIHIENQSTPQAAFGRRMFRYFTAFFEKFDLPVYPIVVFSYDQPYRAEPDIFAMDFPDGDMLRFHYRVVQLNRLPWRRFMKQANPVASALMAKMKIAPRDRHRVKLECLRLLATLKLDPARMRLISGFVDSYLRLTREEERRFERAIVSSGLAPAEKEQIMEVITSWMQAGIERGIEQGIAQGIERGEQREAQSVILRLGTRRFGSPTGEVETALQAANQERLELLVDRLLEAESWEELLA
jgi:Domain of unknown function (DUF4351)